MNPLAGVGADPRNPHNDPMVAQMLAGVDAINSSDMTPEEKEAALNSLYRFFTYGPAVISRQPNPHMMVAFAGLGLGPRLNDAYPNHSGENAGTITRIENGQVVTYSLFIPRWFEGSNTGLPEGYTIVDQNQPFLSVEVNWARFIAGISPETVGPVLLQGTSGTPIINATKGNDYTRINGAALLAGGLSAFSDNIDSLRIRPTIIENAAGDRKVMLEIGRDMAHLAGRQTTNLLGGSTVVETFDSARRTDPYTSYLYMDENGNLMTYPRRFSGDTTRLVVDGQLVDITFDTPAPINHPGMSGVYDLDRRISDTLLNNGWELGR